MLADYDDILSRIKESPKWWDENGVPRFCDFTPSRRSNIYAGRVKLLLIACQGCGQQFTVCMSHYKFDRSEKFEDNYYGDPPNVGCCGGGATMSSETIRVLESWEKNLNDFTWMKVE